MLLASHLALSIPAGPWPEGPLLAGTVRTGLAGQSGNSAQDPRMVERPSIRVVEWQDVDDLLGEREDCGLFKDGILWDLVVLGKIECEEAGHRSQQDLRTKLLFDTLAGVGVKLSLQEVIAFEDLEEFLDLPSHAVELSHLRTREVATTHRCEQITRFVAAVLVRNVRMCRSPRTATMSSPPTFSWRIPTAASDPRSGARTMMSTPAARQESKVPACMRRGVRLG